MTTPKIPAMYQDLPLQQTISDETAHDVVEQRSRSGEVVVIAPKAVFRTPIWIHPVTASHIGPTSKTTVYAREYSDLIQGQPGQRTRVEVMNPLHPSGRDVSAHGALRYLDLDVLMALGLSWTRNQSPDVEIMQRQVFDWMGYDHLTREPYEELQASLDRMTATTLAIHRPGQSMGEVRPFKVLESASLVEVGGRGNPKIIHARMSDIWANALRNGGWQAIDLVPYSRLVREHRRIGLARVLYVYLASWRNESMRFSVPLWSIRERFAQARPSGQLKYNNPFDPNCQLVRALTTLHRSGVMRIDGLPGSVSHTQHLSGEFLPVTAPYNGGRQQWVIAPGILGNQPRLIDPVVLEIPNGDTGTISTQEVQPLVKDKKTSLLRDDVRRLKRLVPVARSAMKQAATEGWSDEHLRRLFLIVLWKRHNNEIRDPGAFAASELSNKDASAYERPALALTYDLDAILTWSRDDDGPLARISSKPAEGNGDTGTISLRPIVTNEPLNGDV